VEPSRQRLDLPGAISSCLFLALPPPLLCCTARFVTAPTLFFHPHLLSGCCDSRVAPTRLMSSTTPSTTSGRTSMIRPHPGPLLRYAYHFDCLELVSCWDLLFFVNTAVCSFMTSILPCCRGCGVQIFRFMYLSVCLFVSVRLAMQPNRSNHSKDPSHSNISLRMSVERALSTAGLTGIELT